MLLHTAPPSTGQGSRPHRQHVRTGWWVVVLCLLPGCQRHEPAHATDTAEPFRVVSLAPALSQMIVDLGHESLLVGVAQHDHAAPNGLPVVGHWQDVNTESLLALRPTHVLTMTAPAAPPPRRLSQLAGVAGFRLIAYPSPLCVSDITRVILDDRKLASRPPTDQAVSLGLLLGAQDRAQRVVGQIEHVLDGLERITTGAPRLRVLMVIGVAPLMASGPGHVLGELLKACNADNAAADAVVGAPVYDREKLLLANPDVVLMILPGAAPLGPIDTDPRLALMRGLSVSAVAQKRIVLIDDPQAHLPASSVGRVAAAMATAIHPHLCEQISGLVAFDPADPGDR